MTDITWQSDILSGIGTVHDQNPSTKNKGNLWRDPRVLVPATVSVLALSITLATICTCIRRRKAFIISPIYFIVRFF